MEKAEKRVALVTGSGKGIGAGVVRVLSSAGIRCLINCNTNRQMAEETLRCVRDAGGEAFIVQADVSDPAQARMLVDAVMERWGRLDILVNNAAMQYNRFVDEYDLSLIRRLWNINVGGYWRMIREAYPYLRRSPQPRIINIGSVQGKRPTCFDAGYAMTKGAIRMLTREAALEFLRDGITVNCLTLGGCKIEFKTGDFAFHSYRPKGVMNPAGRRASRLVLPEEVGHMILYLCSPEASGITGDCIRIDAGQSLVF